MGDLHIEVISQLKNDRISQEQREGLFYLLLQDHPFWIQRVRKYSSYNEGNRKFYRAQTGEHGSVSRLLAPPVDGSVNINKGRANLEGESKLYCTDQDIYSCFLELIDRKTEDYQYITLLELEQLEDFSVIPVGLTKKDEIDKRMEKSMSKKEFEKYLDISNFINDEFRKMEPESSKYLNSSTLAALVTNEFPHAIGVRFKTIQGFNFSHCGLNYALDPKKSKNYLKPVNALRYKFLWKEDTQYQIQEMKCSIGKISADGTIDFSDYKGNNDAKSG